MVQKQSLWYPFTRFFNEQKRKGNPSEKFFFIEKKNADGEMGNSKRRKCSICFNLEERNEQIFSRRDNNLYDSLDNVSRGV